MAYRRIESAESYSAVLRAKDQLVFSKGRLNEGRALNGPERLRNKLLSIDHLSHGVAESEGKLQAKVHRIRLQKLIIRVLKLRAKASHELEVQKRRKKKARHAQAQAAALNMAKKEIDKIEAKEEAKKDIYHEAVEAEVKENALVATKKKEIQRRQQQATTILIESVSAALSILNKLHHKKTRRSSTAIDHEKRDTKPYQSKLKRHRAKKVIRKIQQTGISGVSELLLMDQRGSNRCISSERRQHLLRPRLAQPRKLSLQHKRRASITL